MGSEIRIGAVGAGAQVVGRHAPGFLRTGMARISAVANRSVASSRKAAALLGGVEVHSRWQDLITDPSVDAILIGTWPDSHAEIAIAAIDAGKHVLIGARLAADASQARAIVAKARTSPEVVVQVVPSGATLRYDATIREQVESIGTVVAAEGTFHTVRGTMEDSSDHWRFYRRFSGVNILDVGKRYESFRRWISGEASTVVAGARKTLSGDDSVSPWSDRLPTTLQLIAIHSTGFPISWSFSAETRAPVEETFRIVGTDAFLTYGLRSGLHRCETQDGSLRCRPVPATEPRSWTVESDFLSAITGDPVDPIITLEDALAYMEFSDAVDRSLRAGTWQPVQRTAFGTE